MRLAKIMGEDDGTLMAHRDGIVDAFFHGSKSRAPTVGG